MKNTLLLFAFLTPLSVLAQDVIYMLNGDEVEAKLTEISSSEIRYRRMDNLDGPVFVTERDKVFKVRYSNGQSEVMTRPGAAPVPAVGSASIPAATASTGTAPVGGFNAAAFAQDGNYFNNQPYVIDRGSGQVVALEKGTPEVKTSTVAAPFYASSSSSWMMKGERSNVRLSRGGEFNFVVKMAPGIDPRDMLKLVRFDLLRRSRRDAARDRHMPDMKITGSWGGASSEQVTENDVRIDVRHLADGVYEVIPIDPLGPNEYAFYIGHKFHAFGID